MPAKLLTERFQFSGGTVDRTGAYPIIRNVLLCGATSANKRRYKAEAFAGDRINRYADRPVFLNHGDARKNNRDYQDKVASVEKPRLNAAGLPVGDLAVNPKHPFAEAFLWDAEHKPGSCGLSHVAQCETKRAFDGFDDVTEIIGVESVDVVIGPATTKGLFEQKGNGVATTIKQLIEWVTKHPKSTTAQVIRGKRLLEFDMGMADTPVMDAPPEDADPEDGLDSAFKAYLHAHVDSLCDESQSIEEFMKKVKDAYKAHSGKGKKEGGDEVSGGADDDVSTEEQRKRAELPYTILSECQAKNFTPGTATLKAMAAMTPTDRAAFIVEQTAKPGHNAERIQSAARRPGAGTAGSGPRVVQTETVAEQRLIPPWD